MIRVLLHGRLGNQMFQYAFGYTLSKQRKELVGFDDRINPNLLDTYFNLSKNKKWCNYLVKKLHFDKNIKQNGRELPEDFINVIGNINSFEGFFQSEKYFINHSKEIKEEFTLKKEYIEAFNYTYGNYFLTNKTIALHIRRTDYLQHGSKDTGGVNVALPLEYYKNFISLFSQSNYTIFIVTDDVEFARKEFIFNRNVIVEENSEIIDFQILQNADIVCIANSSFSWWAAYLHNKPNAKIYSPKYWMGYKIKQEYPKGIIHENWNQIEF